MKKAMIAAGILFLGLFSAVQLSAQEYGEAAYYSDEFQGGKTASGEQYDKNQLTAAHKTHPFGTMLRVTRLDNKKSVVVKVNDRGPYLKGRVVDLSRKAAEAIDLVRDGHAKVKIEVLEGNSAPALTSATSETPAQPANTPAPDLQPKGDTQPAVRVAPAQEEKKAPEKTAEPAKQPATAAKPKEEPKKEEPKKEEPKKPPEAVVVKGKNFQTYDLYKVQLMRPTKEGFGVQVAFMTQHENMLKQVAELQEKWFDNILVSIEKGSDDQTVYKVILGPFADQATANSYKTSLKKKHKIEGFVVDLSGLQQ